MLTLCGLTKLQTAVALDMGSNSVVGINVIFGGLV